MKTASWMTYTGPGRISISRSSPRNAPAGYRIYRPLAPGAWFHAPLAEYQPLYVAQLAQLDAERVWDDLIKLQPNAEPVLLCYEKPPFTDENFCHRRMAADWLERELGVVIPEIGFE